MIRARILGCGAYLPETILTNDDLAKRVETSDTWIRERTGIRERHIVKEGEKTSDLALAAARAALADAGIEASELDMVICATTTPDETFPSVATMVQARLGMTRGAAFDVQAVCSGFIYGLSVADNMIRGGQARTILLIGAESMSRLLDWTDRTTCVLFGDGAGAIVLQAYDGQGTNSDQGVLQQYLSDSPAVFQQYLVSNPVAELRRTEVMFWPGHRSSVLPSGPTSIQRSMSPVWSNTSIVPGVRPRPSRWVNCRADLRSSSSCPSRYSLQTVVLS